MSLDREKLGISENEELMRISGILATHPDLDSTTHDIISQQILRDTKIQTTAEVRLPLKTAEIDKLFLYMTEFGLPKEMSPLNEAKVLEILWKQRELAIREEARDHINQEIKKEGRNRWTYIGATSAYLLALLYSISQAVGANADSAAVYTSLHQNEDFRVSQSLSHLADTLGKASTDLSKVPGSSSAQDPDPLKAKADLNQVAREGNFVGVDSVKIQKIIDSIPDTWTPKQTSLLESPYNYNEFASQRVAVEAIQAEMRAAANDRSAKIPSQLISQLDEASKRTNIWEAGSVLIFIAGLIGLTRIGRLQIVEEKKIVYNISSKEAQEPNGKKRSRKRN